MTSMSIYMPRSQRHLNSEDLILFSFRDGKHQNLPRFRALARESTSAKQNIAWYLTHKEISKALNMLSFLSPNVQSLSQNIPTCAKGNSDKLLSLFSLSLCSHLHVPKPIALLCITYILCLTQLGSKILCLITYPCRPWPWKGKLIYIY